MSCLLATGMVHATILERMGNFLAKYAIQILGNAPEAIKQRVKNKLAEMPQKAVEAA